MFPPAAPAYERRSMVSIAHDYATTTLQKRMEMEFSQRLYSETEAINEDVIINEDEAENVTIDDEDMIVEI